MISVCLATFNGEKYIEDQLKSLISQTAPVDEIIIVDDCSNDSTISIITEVVDKYSHVKLFTNATNLGVVKTFEKAIGLAEGDYIFLCDQGDIWMENKVEVFMENFEDEKVACIVSDAYIYRDGDINLDTFFQIRKSGGGFTRNAIHNSFIGCCMAFRGSIKSLILPFPKNITMHDQWIGLASYKVGNVKFLPDRLILYRRHGKNVTEIQAYRLSRIIRNRLKVVSMLLRLARSRRDRG